MFQWQMCESSAGVGLFQCWGAARSAILAQITSDDVFDRAYEWPCQRRRDYSANANAWARRCPGAVIALIPGRTGFTLEI